MPPHALRPPAPLNDQPGWTPDLVGETLVEAFRTLDRLPRVAGPRRAGNHWPRHQVEWADQLAQAELPADERRAREARRNSLAFRPSGAEIARMDAVLDWLRGLREADPALALVASLWALRAARRRSVRALCRERGWQPAAFYQQRARALALIAARLNAAGTRIPRDVMALIAARLEARGTQADGQST